MIPAILNYPQIKVDDWHYIMQLGFRTSPANCLYGLCYLHTQFIGKKLWAYPLYYKEPSPHPNLT